MYNKHDKILHMVVPALILKRKIFYSKFCLLTAHLNMKILFIYAYNIFMEGGMFQLIIFDLFATIIEYIIDKTLDQLSGFLKMLYTKYDFMVDI